MTVPPIARFDLPGGPVTVRHRLDSARLHLVVECGDEARVLVARVARPTALVLRWIGLRVPGTTRLSTRRVDRGSEAGWWPIGSRFGWGGTFESLASFASRPRRVPDAPERARDGRTDPGGPGAPAGEAACRAHLRAIARALHERLDPAALRVSRAFRQKQRWWFYAAALDDPTGRVAQLASTCPGALLLAREHASAFEWTGHPEHDAASRQILADAVAGMPLRTLIARAIGDRRRRLLVRRAGPWVRCADLARPGLVAFAPEDIPRSTIANMRWYFATSLAAEALKRGPAGPREALSRFVSRHALLLFGRAHRAIQGHHPARAERALEELVARLAAYCDATGRRPTRRSNPISFLEDAAEWHDRTAPARRLERLLARIQTLDLGEVTAVRALGDESFLFSVEGLPYPAPPEAPTESGLVVEPIRSARALEQEGARMRHCVGSLLPGVAAGERFVYSVRWGTLRYTLALAAHHDGSFRIVDLRGVSNQQAPSEVWRRVVRWVERLALARCTSAGP